MWVMRDIADIHRDNRFTGYGKKEHLQTAYPVMASCGYLTWWYGPITTGNDVAPGVTTCWACNNDYLTHPDPNKENNNA